MQNTKVFRNATKCFPKKRMGNSVVCTPAKARNSQRDKNTSHKRGRTSSWVQVTQQLVAMTTTRSNPKEKERGLWAWCRNSWATAFGGQKRMSLLPPLLARRSARQHQTAAVSHRADSSDDRRCKEWQTDDKKCREALVSCEWTSCLVASSLFDVCCQPQLNS